MIECLEIPMFVTGIVLITWLLYTAKIPEKTHEEKKDSTRKDG
jgi:hypothetical protein